MLRKTLIALVATTLVPLCHAQNCATHNTPFSNLQNPTDSQQHSTGFHQAVMQVNGSCTYSDQGPSNANCAVACSAVPTTQFASDQGLVILYTHGTNTAFAQGGAGSNGPQVTCGAQVAAAVRSCPAIFPSCDISVTLSASSNGLGGSVSYSNTPIWNPTLNYPFTCAAYQNTASYPCTPNGPPPNALGEYTWAWDYATCQWVATYYNNSPIVIDTNGEGFHLTSAAEGVLFDFYGTGHPIQMAWTAAESRNGWLALPNKDGKITSARELFGNLTPQYMMPSHPPNGFAALAVWDDRARGGNGSNTIDPGDAVWEKLRVWIDKNHDGIAQEKELHTLDSLGIGSIDLAYMPATKTDQYGNQFRYQGDIKPLNKHSDIDPKIYDVYLVTK